MIVLSRGKVKLKRKIPPVWQDTFFNGICDKPPKICYNYLIKRTLLNFAADGFADCAT